MVHPRRTVHFHGDPPGDYGGTGKGERALRRLLPKPAPHSNLGSRSLRPTSKGSALTPPPPRPDAAAASPLAVAPPHPPPPNSNSHQREIRGKKPKPPPFRTKQEKEVAYLLGVGPLEGAVLEANEAWGRQEEVVNVRGRLWASPTDGSPMSHRQKRKKKKRARARPLHQACMHAAAARRCSCRSAPPPPPLPRSPSRRRRRRPSPFQVRHHAGGDWPTPGGAPRLSPRAAQSAGGAARRR